MSFLELAPLPGAIPCARLHTVHVLHEWGLRDQADDATLIVSELVTNAVDASVVLPERPADRSSLAGHGAVPRIEAWDRSPLDLEPRDADTDDECGRGLTVVAALSDRWGSKRTGYHAQGRMGRACSVSGDALRKLGEYAWPAMMLRPLTVCIPGFHDRCPARRDAG